MLWYQGESDCEWPELYYNLLTYLTKHCRELWRDDSPSFFIVQLATFGGENPDGEDWAILREAQEKFGEDTSLVGTINTMDVGKRDNIHPFDKKTVGHRLGIMAGFMLYETGENPYGPKLENIIETETAYKIMLKHTSGGLYARDGVVKGFMVEDASGNKKPVEARIVGDHIEIDKIEGREVKSISYGYRNFIGHKIWI